jgi:hypothetical protein
MSDIYKVSVAMVLQNGVSPMLAVIGRDLMGLHTKIKGVEEGFGGWASRLKAVAGVLASGAILGGLTKIAEHGEKLLDQQDRQGSYYDKIAKAVPTSTASEYLKTVNELRAVTGTTAGAEALAPKAMMVDTLLSNSLGREVHGEYYKLLRSAEMKGISTDPAKLEAFTDQAFRMITAFGGKLSADDFQTLARRGGTAFMNAKPEAIGPLGVLAADLGGSAAGTTLMTLQQLQTGANTLSRQQADTLANLGLLDLSKTTKTGFGGSKLQLQPGAITGSLEHVGDLPGWIKEVVYPALLKAAHGDDALVQNLIAKISPNRNAAKLIEMFGNPKFLEQQEKDLGLAGQIESIPDAYKHFVDRNPVGVKKAFNDQYESMMQAIGAPIMQAAIPVMKSVTSMFTSFGQFANSHPEAIKYLAEGVAALAIGLAGISVAAIVAIGGIPAAITGVVLALGSLAALNWQAIVGVFDGIKNAIASFIAAISSLYDRVIKQGNDLLGGGGQPAVIPNSWRHQGSAPAIRPTPISLTLNVDGRTMASALVEHLIGRFDTMAPASNGADVYGV